MCNWARCRSAPCAAWTVRTGALGLAAVAVLALAGTLTAVLYQAARARELDELEEEFAIYSLARASDLIAPFTRHMEGPCSKAGAMRSCACGAGRRPRPALAAIPTRDPPTRPP